MGADYTSPMTGETIIVVEDDALTAGLVSDIVETMGHRVEIVSSIEPAFQLARTHQPVAMLVDVNLGGESGLDLMTRLAGDSQTAAIPVVAMTALDGEDDGAVLERAGAVALLEKPFSTADVIALVSGIIAAGPK